MRNAELWDVEDAVPYDQMERVRKSVGAGVLDRPVKSQNDCHRQSSPPTARTHDRKEDELCRLENQDN